MEVNLKAELKGNQSNIFFQSNEEEAKMTVSSWQTIDGHYSKDLRAEAFDVSDGTSGILLTYGGDILATLEVSPEHGVRFMNYVDHEYEPEITRIDK